MESVNRPMLLDIRVEKDFAKRHMPGALPTDAYPAKTDEERAKLKPALNKTRASRQDVLIVCHGGG